MFAGGGIAPEFCTFFSQSKHVPLQRSKSEKCTRDAGDPSGTALHALTVRRVDPVLSDSPRTLHDTTTQSRPLVKRLNTLSF